MIDYVKGLITHLESDYIVVDVRDNGRRLLVRNDRAQEILVLDTAGQPEREERSPMAQLASDVGVPAGQSIPSGRRRTRARSRRRQASPP